MVKLLLLAQLLFPNVPGAPQLKADAGRWELQETYTADTVTYSCCVLDTVQRRSVSVVWRDASYYGYPEHYNLNRSMPSPGDTIRIITRPPNVDVGPLIYPVDSVQLWLEDSDTGDTLGTAVTQNGVPDSSMFVLRPLAGDSIRLYGCYRPWFSVGAKPDSLGGFQCGVNHALTIYSDSLVFPILSDSITIDTIGMAHDFIPPSGLAPVLTRRFGASSGFVAGDFSGTDRDGAGLDAALARRMARRRDTGHDRPAVRADERRGRYPGSVPATRGRLGGRDGMLPTVYEPRRATPDTGMLTEYDHVLLAGIPNDCRWGGDRHAWAGGGGHGVA